jgi:beta-ribofuranosylaminobenzene 5'-phosphate synthase
MTLPSADEVVLTASGRVHVTLIDMNGSGGRRDGSVGFVVDEPRLVLAFRHCDRPAVIGDDDGSVAREVRRVGALVGLTSPVAVEVRSTIPRHVGLGSGTQLRMAVAAGLAHLAGEAPEPERLTALSGRGGTSGIGVHGFFHGGFLVDAGHRVTDKDAFLPSRFAVGVEPPKLLFAHRPPRDWRILLVLPDGPHGLSGASERDFMAGNTPVDRGETHTAGHLVLMGLMAAVAEQDLPGFGAALTALQDTAWKARHWRRAELRDWRPALDVLVSAGVAGAGLSSTGPLLYGVYDGSRLNGADLVAEVGESLASRGYRCRWITTAGFGQPATVDVKTEAGAVEW